MQKLILDIGFIKLNSRFDGIDLDPKEISNKINRYKKMKNKIKICVIYFYYYYFCLYCIVFVCIVFCSFVFTFPLELNTFICSLTKRSRKIITNENISLMMIKFQINFDSRFMFGE